jgi:hypothetical protein
MNRYHHLRSFVSEAPHNAVIRSVLRQLFLEAAPPGIRTQFCSLSFLFWTSSAQRASMGRGVRGGPLGEARVRTLRRNGGSVMGLFVSVVLQDFQIRDRVRERIAEAGLDAVRRKDVQLLALCFGKIQFSLPNPCLGNGQIVGD